MTQSECMLKIEAVQDYIFNKTGKKVTIDFSRVYPFQKQRFLLEIAYLKTLLG